MSEFVPASQLYNVESRTPIAHPAHHATDEQVREAVEALDREVRADGGTSRVRYGREEPVGVDPSVTVGDQP